MPRNMTKSRKSKAVRRRERQRRQRGLICLFLLLSIGAFASLGLMNQRPTAAPDSWYVAGGEMEILAAPRANSRAQSTESPPAVLPFMQTTPEPTPIPTPTAAPMPEPTQPPVMTFATPTTEPMLALVPEATLTPAPTEITITAVGDCTLGGDIPSGAYQTFASYYEEHGPDYFFANVRHLFENDDLTIINLEGPLTTSENLRAGRAFNFRGLPEYVDILSGSSVEICNVANNHALDFGAEGLYETTDILEAEDIGVSGFGRMYYTDVKGIRVGSLGFTEWDFEQHEIEAAVRTAREHCDLLIVSMHWGKETDHEATALQRKLGHAIVDAGADVVLGTHTHVYGGVELYKGKYIVYSLGNFCFGGNRNPNDKNTMIFQQTFRVEPDGTVSDAGISLIPASISSSAKTNDFQPRVLDAERGQALLGQIAGISRVDMAQVLWHEESYQNQLTAHLLSQG